MSNFKLSKDIEKTLIKYPSLIQIKPSKFVKLEGKVPLNKLNGDLITEYLIRIQYPKNFPYVFPTVYEIGEKIPRVVERHINQNGSMCFAIRAAERIKCLHGISTLWFIDEILIPHLAAQYLFDNGHTEFLDRGYKHFDEGIKEYYLELFNTESLAAVLDGFNRTLKNTLPERNDPCYCGSQRKYKQCHFRTIETLKNLGHQFLADEFETLKDKI